MKTNAIILNAFEDKVKKVSFDIQKITDWEKPYPFGSSTGTLQIPELISPKGEEEIDIDFDHVYWDKLYGTQLKISIKLECSNIGADWYEFIYATSRYSDTWIYLTSNYPYAYAEVLKIPDIGKIYSKRIFWRARGNKGDNPGPWSEVASFSIRIKYTGDIQ